ncbi:TIGR00282 family metallophosphoesterase [Deinococcus radiophilus]|uniref:YmdB family metallophosphoesterase n=1 Tax=Deinococcus radiophilus TaxID=32062 RepID=A0A3S0IK30_9DEIO|nr:TIGR00282 family metallophosphoesterase [Deinococcus radiophilus]RTR25792.1 YmdB family metallophosphoesterase [Deinococcus radiophilus]UFA50837.1 YmdB family metallophosphoesterase [Deinococcus radiophilus]
MKVLFVGDVYGQPGRRVVNDHLPLIAPNHDFVIVNAENSAGGFGVHYDAATRLLEAGANCLTLGNHAWDHKDIHLLLGQPDKFPIVRPLNYSDPETPGMGWRTFEVDAGDGMTERLTVVNLLGRVFMGESANPFRAIDELLRRDDLGSVFVDFHAETTSEKAAMGWHLDGRVAAVIGTHTHVATADTRILPGGTGFQTDAGFTGPLNSVIGARPEEPLLAFLTERRHRFQMGEGPAMLNAVALEISGGRCLHIERYRYEEEE